MKLPQDDPLTAPLCAHPDAAGPSRRSLAACLSTLLLCTVLVACFCALPSSRRPVAYLPLATRTTLPSKVALLHGSTRRPTVPPHGPTPPALLSTAPADAAAPAVWRHSRPQRPPGPVLGLAFGVLLTALGLGLSRQWQPPPKAKRWVLLGTAAAEGERAEGAGVEAACGGSGPRASYTTAMSRRRDLLQPHDATKLAMALDQLLLLVSVALAPLTVGLWLAVALCLLPVVLLRWVFRGLCSMVKASHSR